MATPEVARQQPPGRTGWRLRALLLLVALMLHVALLSFIRFSKFALSEALAPQASHLTVTLAQGVSQPESAVLSERNAEVPARAVQGTKAVHHVHSNDTAQEAMAPTSILSVTGANPKSLNAERAAGGQAGDQTDRAQNNQPDKPLDKELDGQLDVENLERQTVLIAQDRNVTFEMPRDRLIHAPSAKEKLAEAVNRSARSDCRTAYAGGGPLAIPFLLENTITGTGCKW